MTLATLGFAPSTADLSLLLHTDTSLPPFYILVYVDDLVFATADTKALALVLLCFGFRFSSPQSTPLPTGHSLSDPPSDESVEPSGPYPELVGCLMYLMTCTRPYLAYPLSILARYIAYGRHRPEHWEAAKKVLRYLCSTLGMGLVLGGRGPVVLTGHTDASWVDDLATQQSSRCEAEIYAGAMAAQKLRWLTYLLTDLGERPRSPPVLTKHIALRYFLARELQQRGQLRLAYMATRANIADIFTKALQSAMAGNTSAGAGESSAQNRRSSQDSGVSVPRGVRTNQGSLIKEVLKNFTVEKFNGEGYDDWACKMQLYFRQIGLLKLMIGEEPRPSDPALQEDWDERASAGYYLMSQSLELNQCHHVMHLLPEVDCGPKAWTVLKELHALTSVVATSMLERELSALCLSKGEPVQPVLDKMRDLYAKLAMGADEDSGGGLCRRQLRGGDDGSSGYGIQGRKRGRGRGFGGAGCGAKKDDDSNDQQGGTGWGRGAKSGRGGKSDAGGKMKGSCWYYEKEGHPWFLCYKKPDGWTPQNRHQDGGTPRNQKNGANMVADLPDNNPKSNGGAEKKERTAGQFFHIGEQGEQGDASAKVGAELHPLDYWVLDTGATWTMTPRKDLLDDVRAAPINKECSASRHALKVAGAGRAAFKGADGKPVVLHDVLLVPDLKANLISLRKLAKARVSTSMDGTCTYKGQLGNRVLWDLHESKDVYRSMWQLPALAWHGGGQAGEGSASQGECNAVGGVGVKVSARSGETDWAMAHRRLGHRDWQEQEAFGAGSHRLGGAAAGARAQGGAVFLTIVDDWSRLMWAYPLKQKDHAASTIQEDWLPLVEKQAECVVKQIRTDRGGEFLGAEMTAWLKKQGIQRELTTAYTPQSNGVAERANRTILKTARALLMESGVGNSMWPHAIRHATVARNRVLTKVGNESWVPLERWLGGKPPVDMLRMFGCMAVTHVPKKYRSKLGARAIWCVHLGLAAESKGWLLWEPSKGVLFDSRDVKFVEGMMYGGWKKQPETKVSQQMEQITMQLDLTPSVWEEGEEAAAEGGDGEKVQEAPARGGDDVETTGSTKEAAGSEGEEQQQGKTKVPTLPSRRKPKGVVMRGWEIPVSRPGRTRMATMKLTAGADVAEQQLENEEALLILPHGYDPDEEDEPAYCFHALAPEEPASMEEALAGPDREKWLVSRDAEYQSLLENGTWDLVVLPEGKKAIQCKWVLRIQIDYKGQVTIYKNGAVSGKFIIQMDISTAFFNGILEEDVYMTQQPGYEDGTGRVCKLKKSIYGLKQAPRRWYQKLAAVLEEMGFRTSSCDESLFLKGEGEKLVLFLVYVDDILLFSSSMKEIQKMQQQLMKNIKCKTLGEVKYYLRMHVERDLDHRWLKLHQEKFIKELGEKYGIENERKVATPLPAEFNLVKAAEDEGVEAEEQQQFQSFVGSLLYAAVYTRPDISFSVGQLARVVQNPSEEQVDAAERVVKYLNSHPSIGVQYSTSAKVKQKGVEVLKEKGERLGEGKLFLTCFTDATWAYEKDDSSSIGGNICVVGGGPVGWRSKKQTETTLSSVESEYMAMFHGVKEVIWLRRLLEEIGQEQKVATPLFCDSKGALGMARNVVLHGLNKHMHIKWHWLRKEVKRGTVNPIYIKTHQQLADFLTKMLADEPHWRCVRMSGMSMN
ncbi:unnamed protein product [Closterium sp. NIES-53]